MNYINQITGWGAFLVGLAGIGLQHDWLCAIAVLLGFVAVRFEDIREQKVYTGGKDS